MSPQQAGKRKKVMGQDNFWELKDYSFKSVMQCDLGQVEPENKFTPLMKIASENRTDFWDFTAAQIMEIARRSDLKALDSSGQPALFYLIHNNQLEGLQLSPEQIMEIARGSDLSKTSPFMGETVFCKMILENKTKNLGLRAEHIMELVKKVYLDCFDVSGNNPLMYLFTHNQDQNLNLSPGQLMQIARATNLKKYGKSQKTKVSTALMAACAAFSPKGGLKLGAEHFLEMARNSDLSNTDGRGNNELHYVCKAVPRILPELLSSIPCEDLIMAKNKKGETPLDGNPEAKAIYEKWKLQQGAEAKNKSKRKGLTL